MDTGTCCRPAVEYFAYALKLTLGPETLFPNRVLRALRVYRVLGFRVIGCVQGSENVQLLAQCQTDSPRQGPTGGCGVAGECYPCISLTPRISLADLRVFCCTFLESYTDCRL